MSAIASLCSTGCGKCDSNPAHTAMTTWQPPKQNALAYGRKLIPSGCEMIAGRSDSLFGRGLSVGGESLRRTQKMPKSLILWLRASMPCLACVLGWFGYTGGEGFQVEKPIRRKYHLESRHSLCFRG